MWTPLAECFEWWWPRRWMKFFEWFLTVHGSNPKFIKMLWTGEAPFKTNGRVNWYSFFHWSCKECQWKESLIFQAWYLGLEFEPFFIKGAWNLATHNDAGDWRVPWPRWWMWWQDGAQSHYVCNNNAVPSDEFPVHFGPQGSIEWPSSSPDVNTLWFLLLGFSKKPEHVLQTKQQICEIYEGWNFNSGNYLFTTDTK